MYLKFYGLSKRPFELTPKVHNLFLGESHKEGLAVLKYGVISDKGFLLLTGGVGTGKTTLVNCLATSLGMTEELCLISNPNLEIAEFYHFFANKIGLSFEGNKSKFFLDFEDLLKKNQQSGKKILLIIDEAHVLEISMLEEIRLLTNISAGYPGGMSVFLVGQPELVERLEDDRLRPLRQRISLRFHLDALSREDTLQYILFRLNLAEAQQTGLFTDQAIDEIHRASKGNPRVINIICDSALLAGYGKNSLQIGKKIVRDCIVQQQLPAETGDSAGPQNKSFMENGLFWLLLILLCVESAGVWFAYQSGLLDGFWNFVKSYYFNLIS